MPSSSCPRRPPRCRALGGPPATMPSPPRSCTFPPPCRKRSPASGAGHSPPLTACCGCSVVAAFLVGCAASAAPWTPPSEALASTPEGAGAAGADRPDPLAAAGIARSDAPVAAGTDSCTLAGTAACTGPCAGTDVRASVAGTAASAALAAAGADSVAALEEPPPRTSAGNKLSVTKLAGSAAAPPFRLRASSSSAAALTGSCLRVRLSPAVGCKAAGKE